MKHIFPSKFFRYATVLLYSLPLVSMADTLGGSGTNQGFQIQNPLNSNIGNSLPNLITAILNNIIEPLAAVAVVVMIIYSGFKFLTAQGNPGEIKKAQEGLLWVLIGAGILLGAAAISAAVSGTFNQLLAN